MSHIGVFEEIKEIGEIEEIGTPHPLNLLKSP
jgi:hypothetical protein